VNFHLFSNIWQCINTASSRILFPLLTQLFVLFKTPRKTKNIKKGRHVSQSALFSKSTIATIHARIKTLRASEKLSRPLIAMRNVAWSWSKIQPGAFHVETALLSANSPRSAEKLFFLSSQKKKERPFYYHMMSRGDL
jgi:hypothetical protein